MGLDTLFFYTFGVGHFVFFDFLGPGALFVCIFGVGYFFLVYLGSDTSFFDIFWGRPLRLYICRIG